MRITKKYLVASAVITLLFIMGVGISGRYGGPRPVVASSGESGHGTAVQETDHGGQTPPGHAVGHDSHAAEVPLLTPDVSPFAWMPLIMIFFPLFTALLIPYFYQPKNQKIRDAISVGTTVITLLLLLSMYGPVVNGTTIHGHFYKGIGITLPFFPGFDATFKVDPAAMIVAAVTIFLWILSTINAIDYMTIEEKRPRYELFVLASLAMNLGVLMAGDFLTLFVFFEGMVIFPYPLIAHKEDEGAMRGANMYLRLGVATSLSLFFGVMLLQHFTGSIAIRPMGAEINAAVPGMVKYIMAALLIIGFGGKAGLFFEHVWLPNAHPVAPTPASCLLSGAMIKAGAYGIFRVVNMIFVPPQWGMTLEWVTARHVGYAVIWVGIITMFFGVLNALISANSKRMLAYHSVSQMGYIVMGIGCAAYLGADGAMGWAGAIYHIFNHALFKASLFLTVGAVYFRTHELDMYKNGGLWRNMPFTCVAMFIAACGIAGIPGFNGFASKTLLHHSILEAYEHSAHFSADGLPDFKLRIAEVIFMLTAGGTFASNMKLWVLDFFGKRPEKYKDVKPAPMAMKVSLGLVSAAILFIGLFPNWMIEKIIGPALSWFSFNPASHPYHVLYNTHAADGAIRSTIPILYNPVSGAFFSDSEVMHNILGGGDAVIFGGIIFILGMRFGWFHAEVPEWLTVNFYMRTIYHTFRRSCFAVFATVDALYNRAWESIIYGRSMAAVIVKTETRPEVWDIIGRLEGRWSEAVDGIIYGHGILEVVQGATHEPGEEKETVPDNSELWKKLTEFDKKYDGAFDQAIYSHGIKELIGGGGDEAAIWVELKKMEDKYGEAFDRAIFSHGMKGLIGSGEEEAEIWMELRKMEDKYGEAFDKMIVLKDAATYLKKTGKGEDSGLSRLWEKFSEFDSQTYDPGLDKLFFGNVDPNARPEENWFKRLCRRLSSVHSGDISRYISWVLASLTLLVAFLIGMLYVSSFLGFIILGTVILLLVIMGIVLS